MEEVLLLQIRILLEGLKHNTKGFIFLILINISKYTWPILKKKYVCLGNFTNLATTVHHGVDAIRL
jgi:hypothetical protein